MLLAEDSSFFRNHVKSFIDAEGYEVIACEDGQVAWDALQERADDIDMLVTDIEMPNMTGFELTEKLRAEERFKDLPVIALTTRADVEATEKGKAVGIDNYQVKLDREQLLKAIALELKKGETS
ncbi:response regulator [Candidatus Auribacterota bacterium]